MTAAAGPVPPSPTPDPQSLTPDPDLGAAGDPVPAPPALDLPSTAPPPVPERTEDPGAKTSEDIPVVELTEDELARYAPDMVALQQLIKIERIYGAGSNPGSVGSDRPSASEPGAIPIKPILPRPVQAVPSPDQAVRAPPD
jgi:hypothetical protein